MPRPKRTESDPQSPRPTGILAEVPSVAHLERRLLDLQEEADRVERILACLRGLESGPATTA